MNKYTIDELNLKLDNIHRANDFFLEDLSTFLNYLFQKGGIKTSNNFIPVSNIKDIVPNFIYPIILKKNQKENKIPYMFVMDMLSRILLLVDVQVGILYSKSASIEKFNMLSKKKQLEKIYKNYINNKLINEIKQIPKLKIGWKNKTKTKSILIKIRKMIDAILLELEKGYWYSINEMSNIIDTSELISNIKSAKYGMVWIIYNGEMFNQHIIINLLLANIFDVYLRHLGIVSTYIDSSNFLEDIGIETNLPSMFEYKGINQND